MNESNSSSVNYELLRKMAASFKPFPRSLVAHPDAIKAFADSAPEVRFLERFSPRFGISVFPNPFAPKHPKKWQFPADRFVEYEAKDEEWARPVGHGREVDDMSRYVAYAFKTPLSPF